MDEGEIRSNSGGADQRALEGTVREETWPALPYAQWKETCDTLHLWTQVVGKIRMQQAAPVNHWWHVPLYVTSRGLGTSPIPYGERAFEIDFDLFANELRVTTSEHQMAVLPLQPMPVASFYRRLMATLADLDIVVPIYATPVEMADPIPFEEDVRHASYDAEFAKRFLRVLLQADMALRRFRSGFVGKASPVNFFWGGFDLAVSVYSGRRAPVHPEIPGVPNSITREAYSHEVIACGFWPGDERFSEAAFYGYAYPEPSGFSRAPVPAGAFYSNDLGEFVLPYEVVREAADPHALLDAFNRAVYVGAAVLGGWDRQALERGGPPVGPIERSGARGSGLQAP